MGDLLRNFNYPRNAFGRTPAESAQKVLEVLDRAERSDLLRATGGSVKDEAFNDMRLFLAVVGGQPEAPHVTLVGERYRELAISSPEGAWRWLSTRAMWLYSVPNESNTAGNRTAKNLGVAFNFFDMITRLVVHFSALPHPKNILYFDELLAVLDHDDSWSLQSEELHDKVLSVRRKMNLLQQSDHQSLLDELEPGYGLPRDSVNTLFRKAFGQCGLFDVVATSGKLVGLRLDTATYDNPVLGERLRFVLDHPKLYAAEGSPNDLA